MDKHLRGYLIAMLAGAGIMALVQVVNWPPEGRVEVPFAWFTVAAVLIAVGLALYEWRRNRSGPEK